MSEPRFFLEEPCAPGSEVELHEHDVRHAALVLRLKPGDEITIVSGRISWRANVLVAKGDRVTATIEAMSAQPSGELPVEITILQALPKAAKMDDVVEKAVELGAARIVPIRCERSYGGESDNKIERWRRIARAAAQQSQRLFVPVVDAPAEFNEAIARFAARAHVIVAHEQARTGTLAAALQRVDANSSLALAVGPEGSFTTQELEFAKTSGCDIVSLGPTILRTETAAAALLAAIAALRGWW